MGKPTGFMEIARQTSTELPPEERIQNFNEFHIPLPGLVGTGIRQPAANQLSGRNGIGVYRQRISDTHPLGSDYRLVFFLHGGNHFGQIFFVHLLTSA